MSTIDMDDLVASLSSTCHIGQEAIDLAALQVRSLSLIFRLDIGRVDTAVVSSFLSQVAARTVALSVPRSAYE